MYNQIADKLARILISNAGDCVDERYKNPEIVIYGIEMMLSSLVNLIVVMGIGGYFFGILSTVVFVLFFCPIRQFAGGFHAKTHMTCIVEFLILFLIIGKCTKFIRNMTIGLGIWCILGGIISLLSPIDVENKRLSQKHKRICKHKIFLLLFIESMCMIGFVILHKLDFIQMAVAALGLESILLTAGKIINQRGEKNVNCNM